MKSLRHHLGVLARFGIYVRRYFRNSLPSGPRSLALFVVDMISSSVVTLEDVQAVIVRYARHDVLDIFITSNYIVVQAAVSPSYKGWQ
jgi:hypothetical protein